MAAGLAVLGCGGDNERRAQPPTAAAGEGLGTYRVPPGAPAPAADALAPRRAPEASQAPPSSRNRRVRRPPVLARPSTGGSRGSSGEVLGLVVTARTARPARIAIPTGVPVRLSVRSGDERAHVVVLAGARTTGLRVDDRRPARLELSGLPAGRYRVRVDGRPTAAVLAVVARRAG